MDNKAERAAYHREYYKTNMQRIPLNLRKEHSSELKAWCKEHGTTVQGLIKRLLTEETGIQFDKKRS